MRLMPFLIMLAVVSVSGSILFAAEPVAPPTQQTQPAAKAPDKTADTKTPAAAGATPSKAPEAKTDAKAAPKADDKPDEKSGPGKAAEHDAAEAGSDEPSDQPGEKSHADKSSPQRFVPSEQVRADFDVSFPVDI